MQKLRSMLASAAGIIFSIYLVSCSFAAIYFNYDFANNNGFMSWLMLGEISSTFKGLVWPYYLITSDHKSHSGGPLNHDEIVRFSEIVPSRTPRPQGLGHRRRAHHFTRPREANRRAADKRAI